MRKVFLNGLPAYQFHLLQKFSDSFGHAVFGREGGVSKKPFDTLNLRLGGGDKIEDAIKNREIVCGALGVKYENLISAEQTHGRNIQIVDGDFLQRRASGACAESLHGGAQWAGECYGVDAFVTDVPDIALMIKAADCQAILMLDPVKKVVAAVHAGWKGLAQNISAHAVKIMAQRYGCDPANILAGISPSLGPCCAFFSDPEKELPAEFGKYIDKKKRVDLWEFSVAQLVRAGIKRNHVELARICTQCNNGQTIEGGGRFFSFRGEKGITGRFGSLIFIKPII
jgi:polyphenol oxidase